MIIRLACGFIIGVCLLLSPLTNQVAAESLWSDSPSGNLYADHKAHAIGDPLTIIVSENSSTSRTGQASNSKSASLSGQLQTSFFGWQPSASGSESDSFKAQGSLANTNNVTARLTAQIVGINPNGSLNISGTQIIKQNGEDQKIIITGTIRPDDITADNTVYSSAISNAQISIEGHGPIANKQRQGIFTQLFNFLF